MERVEPIAAALSAQEREQLRHALAFALGELFAYAHEEHRVELETLMRFLARLEVAGEGVSHPGEAAP